MVRCVEVNWWCRASGLTMAAPLIILFPFSLNAIYRCRDCALQECCRGCLPVLRQLEQVTEQFACMESINTRYNCYPFHTV